MYMCLSKLKKGITCFAISVLFEEGTWIYQHCQTI